MVITNHKTSTLGSLYFFISRNQSLPVLGVVTVGIAVGIAVVVVISDAHALALALVTGLLSVAVGIDTV